MRMRFAAPDTAGAGALAVRVAEGAGPQGAAAALDAAAGGAISRTLAGGRWKGASGKTLELLAVSGVAAERIVLVGSGEAEPDADAAATMGAAAYAAVKASGAARLALRLDLSPALAAHAAFGVRLAAYRFDRYRTTEKPDAKPSVEEVVVEVADPAAAEAAFSPLAALADAVAFARDLVSEPANVLFPEEYARRIEGLGDLGLEVEVLDQSALQSKGFGLLLAVGQGSERESRVVVMRWRGGADPDAPPVAFVGKGVTFDTGGISLKPADGMEDMKWDMGGSAAVVGVMHALAGRKAKVNAVGVVGLVENMPDGRATRPGDVVTSLSGQTVEVINTDAEGRLVLGDCLWWTQETYKPRFMVDLATLTGAIIVGLGNDFGGLFSNDDALSHALLAAGEATGDTLWRMPLPPAYEKLLDSPIADMKNIGGRAGGSITAALFLQRFVRDKLPWAHLDIAGTAWRKGGGPLQPDGATGFGVRLLDRLVADGFEG
ncbi:MAG: leucyl aminopeptidase [Caulobacteraceae bacterium]|nr:leucyl aminopeptidase [Caulobacter sp.]